ncbi:MAG TPA: AAA family ATPase [Ktedonobacteraceae bacterium]|nr:AAA family ATPase [Ktedonobacteraceae bacterium]
MPTQKPCLIIITGLSGTGKTTLGKRLAQELRLPFIYKDGIKELLFDDLGWHDRAWSRKLGQATYSILYHVIEAQLTGGCSLIVESNFSPKFSTPDFLSLQQCSDFDPFQILCFTMPGDLLLQRCKNRVTSGQRHPGHVEHLCYEELAPSLLKGREDPLPIGGPVLEVDTTDFSAIDYKKIVGAVSEFIADRR